MRMTPIYLCDDEPMWLNYLKQVIADYPTKSSDNFYVAFSGNSPSILLQYLKEHTINGGIYFLDVVYKTQMNGMELGQNIRRLDSHATLIYITNHEEMMRETFRFKLQVLDYILKNDEDLPERIHQCLSHLEQSCPMPSSASSQIIISMGRSRLLLAKEEIYYANTEKGSHQIQIHTKTGMVIAYTTLYALEQQLGDTFISCSRSMLVNPCHIISADHHTRKLLLDNGETCSCSTRMWRNILDRLDIMQKLPKAKITFGN